MYRLTYYNYADASTVMTGQRGYDRVRQTKIGLMDFKCNPTHATPHLGSHELMFLLPLHWALWPAVVSTNSNRRNHYQRAQLLSLVSSRSAMKHMLTAVLAGCTG